jgi:phosphoesterase RecJ-like protein
MELSLKQQSFELIQKSKKILLITKQYPTVDSIGSVLALGLALEKANKEIDMVCPGPFLPMLSFFPSFSRINKNIKSPKNFLISLDTSEVKVAQFSYDFDNDGNKLNIYVTPESGSFNSKHIAAKTTGFRHDLIIVLDSPDLETLGPLYDKNTELFYETPIINIDHQASNEQYGEINIVDTKATTTAEVLYFFLENLGKNLIDANVATCLLAGITVSTKSFQTTNTTPKAFTVAAQLISLGADQQKIIRYLFKNKSIGSLRLWGRALARVKYDSTAKIVWTFITQSDFEKTESNVDDLHGLEEELTTSISGAETALILYEEANQIKGILKANKKSTLENLVNRLNLTPKNNLIYLNLSGKTLVEAEQEILGKIKV